MSISELFEFTFRFNLAAPDTVTWIYVFLTLVFFVAVIDWAWGKMWNREWSFGGHLGSLICIATLGMLAAYSIFNLHGIARMEGWFQQQRLTMARSIADSGKFNRSVLTSTWDKIVSKGGQKDITPPAEGGNEIRLNTPEDTFALALIAVEETRSTLRNKLPFSLGLPISIRNPTDIATEAVDAVRFDASRLPIIAAPTNEWTSTAAMVQTNHALETAYSTLKAGTQDLRTACIWILIVTLIIPIVIIPVNALSDIKINPVPKR